MPDAWARRGKDVDVEQLTRDAADPRTIAVRVFADSRRAEADASREDWMRESEQVYRRPTMGLTR